MEPVTWDFRVHRNNILNSNDRKHWRATKDPKANLRIFGAEKQKELPRFERVAMFVEVSYPDRIPRDVANLHPTIKSYLDGLVHPDKEDKTVPGILPDDNDRYVCGPYLEWSEERTGEKGWFNFRITLIPIPPKTRYRVRYMLHP